MGKCEVETQTTVTGPLLRMETPGQAGRRLAQAVLPKTYSILAKKVKKTIVKRLAAHVLLPRAMGSMHFKFKMDLVPLKGLMEMCEEAGLARQPVVRRGGFSKITRSWKTDGPAATARFASLQQTGHSLAWGGGKLKRPEKGAKRAVSRVMTLMAPPLTVTHTTTDDEESATFEGYLVTYNEAGEMTLPPNHQELWGNATEATKRVLTKYAKRTLGDMFVNLLPVSQTFKKRLSGTQYASSESEYDSTDDLEDEISELHAERET